MRNGTQFSLSIGFLSQFRIHNLLIYSVELELTSFFNNFGNASLYIFSYLFDV